MLNIIFSPHFQIRYHAGLSFLYVALASKRQIKPKADLRAVDSPKKQMKVFGVFCCEG